MITNASVAFGLNVAAVFLIGAAGGLVLTLAGVFKVRTLPESQDSLMYRISCSSRRVCFSLVRLSPPCRCLVGQGGLSRLRS